MSNIFWVAVVGESLKKAKLSTPCPCTPPKPPRHCGQGFHPPRKALRGDEVRVLSLSAIPSLSSSRLPIRSKVCSFGLSSSAIRSVKSTSRGIERKGLDRFLEYPDLVSAGCLCFRQRKFVASVAIGGERFVRSPE